MRKRKTFVALALCAVGGAWLVTALLKESDDGKAFVQSSDSNFLRQSTRQHPSVAPSVLIGNVKVEDQPSRMYEKMETLGSGRAFVEYAKVRPQEGGVYYAINLLKQCQNLRSPTNYRHIPFVKRDDDRTARQLQDIVLTVSKRCGEFSDEELSESAREELGRVMTSNSDPMQHVSQSLKRANLNNDMPGLRSAISQVLEIHDPLMITEDGIGLLRHGDALWFDKKSYPLEQFTLIQALYLAACDLGASCGATNVLVMQSCQLAGRCYESLSELFRNESDALGFQETLALRRKIVTAVKRRNVEMFMPVKPGQS